jgi:hypothetical protein
MISEPLYIWLEPGRSDLDEGLRARVADPVWFLTRQWQLGELQGEDASSPAFVSVVSEHRPLVYDPENPELDPTRVPAEAIVEAGPDDWWTIGRRVRLGRAAAPLLAADVRAAHTFGSLPEPYESLAGEVDGQAVHAAGLLADHDVWAQVPRRPVDRWSPRTLVHDVTFRAGNVELRTVAHAGGDVDWFSVDGSSDGSDAETADDEQPAPQPRQVIPSQLGWPGAPHPRWWQIEDRAVDLGGFAPDRSHLATALLIDLTPAHAEDWFVFPVPSPHEDAHPSSGVLVSLHAVTVHDSFGEEWTLQPPPVEGPRAWSLFRTAGLPPTDLVVWPTAVAPQAGPTLDEVLLGVDEDANLAWAVELRADGRQLLENADVVEARAETTLTGAHTFAYLPSTTLPSHWHPYTREPDGDWRQALLADVTGPEPIPRPGPTSVLIGGPSAGGPGRGHDLEPAALPSSGVRLRRRAMLARDVDGRPVLWVERSTHPIAGPAASHLRFDVLARDPEP